MELRTRQSIDTRQSANPFLTRRAGQGIGSKQGFWGIVQSADRDAEAAQATRAEFGAVIAEWPRPTGIIF
jgi:hypothetical protein